MNNLGFIELVQRMRMAQKAYFKERTHSNLITAKQLEAEVDKVLAQGLDFQITRSLQPKMMNGDED